MEKIRTAEAYEDSVCSKSDKCPNNIPYKEINSYISQAFIEVSIKGKANKYAEDIHGYIPDTLREKYAKECSREAYERGFIDASKWIKFKDELPDKNKAFIYKMEGIKMYHLVNEGVFFDEKHLKKYYTHWKYVY